MVEGQCGVLLGVLGEGRYFEGLSRAERGSVGGDLKLRTYGKYRNMEVVEGQCGVLLGVLGEGRYFDGLSRAERGSVGGDLS